MNFKIPYTHIPVQSLYEEPISYVWRTASSVTGYLKPRETNMPPPVPVPLWKLASATGPYVRFAALSGAAAVILGAYGAHKTYPDPGETKIDQKQVFETASRYHFIHTLALLGLPLCRTPLLAATFLLSGIVMFSGTCYYYAFTGDKQFNRLTPVGGVCFIIGWLSMCI